MPNRPPNPPSPTRNRRDKDLREAFDKALGEWRALGDWNLVKVENLYRDGVDSVVVIATGNAVKRLARYADKLITLRAQSATG